MTYRMVLWTFYRVSKHVSKSNLVRVPRILAHEERVCKLKRPSHRFCDTSDGDKSTLCSGVDLLIHIEYSFRMADAPPSYSEVPDEKGSEYVNS